MSEQERWQRRLAHSRVSERTLAAQQLLTRSELAESLSADLVVLAADDHEEVREAAVGLLESLNPYDAAVLEQLMQRCEDPREMVAYWAVTLLGRAACGDAVGALQRALTEHPVTAVRQRAAWALGRLGPAAAPAEEALRAASQSDDERLARLAEAVLQRLAGAA